MRIAIPIWQDKISPLFDTASRLLIVATNDSKGMNRHEIFLDEDDISRRCMRIESQAIDTLICGAISRPLARLLTARGISVIQDITGLTEEVITAYFQGKLIHPKFLMPGCGKKRGWKKKCGYFPEA